MKRPSSRTPPKRKPVELRFLESVRNRLPRHRHTLEALGNLYTRLGRYEEGLQIDLDLTRLLPREPEAWYTLACSYSLTGRIDDALATLEQAERLGYRDAEWMEQDDDLKAVRASPRYLALLARLRAAADR